MARIRVAAHLIDARSGKHIWAERYEGDLGDIFAVQDEIAQARTNCATRELNDTSAFMGGEVSLRWIYTHMIAEYARHCGHADLIRERIDGASGV